MLGKLVNKFKKQSLQEGTEDAASDAPQQLRKSARLNRSPDNSSGSPREEQRHGGKPLSDDDDEPLFFDSGTESDDEELEQLDSGKRCSQLNTRTFRHFSDEFPVCSISLQLWKDPVSYVYL